MDVKRACAEIKKIAEAIASCLKTADDKIVPNTNREIVEGVRKAKTNLALLAQKFEALSKEVENLLEHGDRDQHLEKIHSRIIESEAKILDAVGKGNESQKTAAEVLKTNLRKFAETKINVKQAPEIKKKTVHSLIVRPTTNKETTGKTTKADINREIDPVLDDLKITGFKIVGNNCVRIESDSAEELKKISCAIKTKKYLSDNYKVEDAKKYEPTLIFRGVSEQITKDDFVRQITQHNSITVVTDAETEMKVLFVKPNPKHKHLKNVVVRCSAEIRKQFLALDYIKCAFGRVFASDFTVVTQCFKCNAFGHIAKFCPREALRCNHCGEDGHVFKDCPTKEDSSKAHCSNCATANQKYPDAKQVCTNHRTTANNCPQKMVYEEIVRRRISYD